jgi:type 1 fimbria pilin
LINNKKDNMKKLSVVMSLALAAMVLLSTSCRKNPADPLGITGSGTMSATIDGKSWSASLDVTALRAEEGFAIQGFDADGNSITLSLDGDVDDKGDYDLGNGFEAGYIDTNASESFVGTSGGITFSKLTNDKAKGEFSFTGIDGMGGMIEVTNGQFDVEFGL